MVIMKVKLIGVLCCWAICSLPATAQQDFKKVTQWLYSNTQDMGGRSILWVYKDGKIVYSQSVNTMTKRQQKVSAFLAKKQENNTLPDADFTETTRIPVASCSKWLSAALVMTFVDEGTLKLTDTIGMYLPVFTAHGKGNITMAQCLSHQTGIEPGTMKEEVREIRHADSMDEVMQEIAEEPMEGEPGKVFHYSNTGLQIAGAVLEKISGKSFKQLFAERLAVPLGMKNTDFGTAKVSLPAGGAISTASDYMNFLTMVLNKGRFNGRQIVSEKSIAEMEVNRMNADVTVAYTPTEAGNFGYGFGLWVIPGGNNEHAYTSPGLFGSFPWVNYEKGYAAVLLTFNIKNEGRNQRYLTLKKLVEEALPK